MTLKEIVVNALGKVKASDILFYNMEGRSPFYDKMVLASVDSQRQADACISYIRDDLAQMGKEVRSIEGLGSPWVLIDLNDIIVSIFTKEERQRLSLEKIYMDIDVERIED